MLWESSRPAHVDGDVSVLGPSLKLLTERSVHGRVQPDPCADDHALRPPEHRHQRRLLALVGAARLELTTPGFGGRYSIQMSYAPGTARYAVGLGRPSRVGLDRFLDVWLSPERARQIRKLVAPGASCRGQWAPS